MKCINCGHENREGVKFCENCGQPLDVKKTCPNCGHENRAGVSFCEQCGNDLATGAVPAGVASVGAAGAPAAPPVVLQVTASPQRRRFNPLWLVLLLLLLVSSCCCLLLLYEQVKLPDFAAQFLNPGLEQVRKVLPRLPLKQDLCEKFDNKVAELYEKDQEKAVENMRFLRPVCDVKTRTCITDITGLEDYELKDIKARAFWEGVIPNIETPTTCYRQSVGGDERTYCEYAYPEIFEPVVYPANTYFGVKLAACVDEVKTNAPVVVEKPDCAALGEKMQAVNTGMIVACEHETDSETPCYTGVSGDNFPAYEVKYKYDGVGSITRASCDDFSGTSLGCKLPAPPSGSCAVDVWVSVDGCDIYLGNKKVEDWPSCEEPPASVPAQCCEVVKSDDVTLFREPPEVGTLFLGFKLACDQPWVLENGTIDWDAYVGDKGDILWTSGSCKYFGEDTRQLECEGAITDQKKSRTKIVLQGCPSLDINFQSPYYAPVSEGCPSAQKCGGSCCAPGCVCDPYDNHCSCD